MTIMPERYSVAGLVKAYHFMKSKLDEPDFRWVNQESEWMGYQFPASDWFAWFTRTDKVILRLSHRR